MRHPDEDDGGVEEDDDDEDDDDANDDDDVLDNGDVDGCCVAVELLPPDHPAPPLRGVSSFEGEDGEEEEGRSGFSSAVALEK
jgi:hypothetical protein